MLVLLEAEECFAEGTIFDLENVIDPAGLQEVAMDIMIENKDEVLDRICFNFKDASGSLIRVFLQPLQGPGRMVELMEKV